MSKVKSNHHNLPSYLYHCSRANQQFLIQPKFGCVSWFHYDLGGDTLYSQELGEFYAYGTLNAVDYFNQTDTTSTVTEVTAPEHYADNLSYLDDINHHFGTALDYADFAGR